MKKTPQVMIYLAKIAKYLFLLFFTLIAVGPIVWAAISSFKTYAEINSSALSWPSAFRLDNYRAAFQYAPIAKYFLNSVVIVGCSVLVTVALVAMCAYIISRFRFKLKTVIVLLISASLMLPAQAKHTLDAVAKTLGVSLENHHRAVDDAAGAGHIPAVIRDFSKAPDL